MAKEVLVRIEKLINQPYFYWTEGERPTGLKNGLEIASRKGFNAKSWTIRRLRPMVNIIDR